MSEIFVAEEGKNIVGFACCGQTRDKEDEGKGELYAIYVIEGMQGKGIGNKLTLEVAKYLKSKGFKSMTAWVLAKNPYKRFYEKL